MSSTCHFVPARVLLLAPLLVLSASACSTSHGTEETDPDSAVILPDATVIPPDAGPSPLECPEVRADATCLESLLAPAGVPFDLPVFFDTCSCCAASECAAAVEGSTIRLTTTLCPDPCDCDGCNTPTAMCPIPALSDGLYEVVVNGAPAFQLPVAVGDPGLLPPPPMCVRYAGEDGCMRPEGWIDPSGYRPGTVCAEPAIGGGAPPSVVVTLRSDCWGCSDLPGPCSVTVEPRFTDDLPPGGEIRVSPTRYPTACDVACGGCWEATERCFVPPLHDGEYYRVWVDGEAVLSLTAGDGSAACTAGGGTPPPR